MPDLLLELLSEEIPARMQRQASDDLRRLVTDGLVERGLTYAHAAAFATPRRLTLAVEGLAERSPRRREERKGPRADAPAPAIEGFLRSTGLSRDQLETRADKKGDVLFAVVEQPGRPAAEIVAETVEATVRAFPWPKSMRWGDGTLRWVRPLHAILCILTRDSGAEVVPFEIDGITAGNTTRGHRFHAPDAFPVASFGGYEAKLRQRPRHPRPGRARRPDRPRRHPARLRRRPRAGRRPGPPRRERRPHRMAGDAARPHRGPLPRPAARGGADHDAREPEVLLAPRPGQRPRSPPTSSSPTARPPTPAPPSSPATPAS